MKNLELIMAIVVCALLCPVAASATIISITEPSADGTGTVTVMVTGGDPPGAPGLAIVSARAEFIQFTYDQGNCGPCVDLFTTQMDFVLLEPDGITHSDILSIRTIRGDSRFFVTFFSDPGLPPPCTPTPGPGCDVFFRVETGEPQLVYHQFFPYDIQFFIQSEPFDVPEPASILLLGTGLAGFFALGRRKKATHIA